MRRKLLVKTLAICKKKYRPQLWIILFMGLIFVWSFFLPLIHNGVVYSNTILCVLGIVAIQSLQNTKSTSRLSWIFAEFALVAWIVVDMYLMFGNIVFDSIPMANLNYLLMYGPGILFLLVASIIYLHNVIKDFYFIQIVSDTVLIIVVSIISVAATTGIFVDTSQLLFNEIIACLVSLVAGIIATSIIIVLMIASSGKLRFSFRVLSFGMFFIFSCDWIFIIKRFVTIRVSDIMVSNIRGFGLLIMIVSCLLISVDSDNWELNKRENARNKYYMQLLMVPQLIMLAIGWTEVIYIVVVALFICVHYFLTRYYIKVQEVESLLANEKVSNLILEEKILERTKELEKINEHLLYLTNTDDLTSLPNRRSFMLNIDERIESGKGFYIMLTDLDRFKIINDIHGHDMGDYLIKGLASRLSSMLPSDIGVYRIGGDEFGFIYGESDEDILIENIIDNIYSVFEMPMDVSGFRFTLDTSVGVSKYPEDASDRINIFKYADIAMLTAKGIASDRRIVRYSSDLMEGIDRKNELELALNSADIDLEFEVYYQGQVDSVTKKLIGAEALLRWYSPRLGPISPNEFIPISENSSMILILGEWVLRKAMIQLKEWNELYDNEFRMGINISPLQFDSANFIELINRIIRDIGVNANNLDFEITETSAMNSSTVMEECLSALSSAGISVSIDDFGTGYSSLFYINRFDIDNLKIAKELVDNLIIDIDTRIIIESLIVMAKKVGVRTVAEGVEFKEQYEYLRDAGCDLIQGYYFSKPLPKDEFEEMFFK